jgi:hypothetical protein
MPVRGFEQTIAKPFGIALVDAQSSGKYASLVLAVLMGGIEAIVPQFHKIHNGTLGIRQGHFCSVACARPA